VGCTYTNKFGSVTHTFPNLDVELQGVHGDLVSGNRNLSSNAFRELFQTSHNGGLPPLVLPMLHLASNNLLSGEQASDVIYSLLQSGSRSLFNALISAQSPAAKAIARSLLPSAIKSTDVPMVRSSLDTGISPDIYTTYLQETPLQLAARVGCTEVTRLLLHYGAKVNPPCFKGSSPPLTIAAGYGPPHLVRLLLGAGAHVNAPCGDDHTSMTALQRAARFNKSEIVRLLLDAGADINAPALGAHGQTALQAAVRQRNVALVEYLLSHGADVNAPAAEYTNTALRVAALVERLDIVKLLLSWGASDVLVAMEDASKQGNIHIVETLLRFGEGYDTAWDEARKRMALVAGVRCGDYQFVRHLLDSGVHVDAPAIGDDTEWTTALQVAARMGKFDIVWLLCSFGADVNAPALSANGFTALQGAASTGDLELAQFLLSAGADVNARAGIYYKSALWAAANVNSFDVVRLLLDSGANLFEQGESAIRIAIENSGSFGASTTPFTKARSERSAWLHRVRYF
jgi:ankyrin repeat protein